MPSVASEAYSVPMSRPHSANARNPSDGNARPSASPFTEMLDSAPGAAESAPRQVATERSGRSDRAGKPASPRSVEHQSNEARPARDNAGINDTVGARDSKTADGSDDAQTTNASMDGNAVDASRDSQADAASADGNPVPDREHQPGLDQTAALDTMFVDAMPAVTAPPATTVAAKVPALALTAAPAQVGAPDAGTLAALPAAGLPVLSDAAPKPDENLSALSDAAPKPVQGQRIAPQPEPVQGPSVSPDAAPKPDENLGALSDATPKPARAQIQAQGNQQGAASIKDAAPADLPTAVPQTEPAKVGEPRGGENTGGAELDRGLAGRTARLGAPDAPALDSSDAVGATKTPAETVSNAGVLAPANAPNAAAAASPAQAHAQAHTLAVPLSGLAVEIASHAHAGKHHFEIRLDPPELGRIDVKLDVDRDGNVSTRLVVDRSDTLDLLKRDSASLERALQQAGLKTSDQGLDFSLRQHAFAERDAAAQADARLVVPDDDPAPLEALRQGYGRLLGLGGGLDIRV